MNHSFSLPTALCLPVPDIEASIQGQTIAVLPQMFLRAGQRFYLYPVEISTVEIDKYYRAIFLPIAKTAWKKSYKPGILLQPQQLNLIETNQQLQLPLSQNNVLIKAWAKCELCRTLDKTESLDILSQLTIWKPERFEEILQNRPHFFLAYLRVYHLDKPLEIPAIPNIQEKLGKFAPLPNNISVSESKPVLSDHIFNQRKQQLENRQPPLHPELEELLFELLQITENNLYNLRPDNSNSFDHFQYDLVPSSWNTNKDILCGSGLFISLTNQSLDIPFNISDEELEIKFLEQIDNNKQASPQEKIILGNPPYNYNWIELDFHYKISKLVLENEIKEIIGWSSDVWKNKIINTFANTDLLWIKDIAKVGNSSDGHEFEKLVRKSLIKLGFSCSNTNPKANLDPDKSGGPGGLDFYCEYPYPVIGECKATKTEKVSDGTAAQLVKLGLKHLRKEKYDNCIKIIIAAGKLTPDAEDTAQGSEMNVIRPETLQKLVTLKAKYPGSIDLFNLKQCLENKPFGEKSDIEINKYIEKVEQEIKLRSHIIQVLKNYLQLSQNESAKVESLHAIYVTSNPPQNLDERELYNILIELSSPLTGYLGRIKEDYWKKDSFYYLRDLSIH